MIVAVSDVVRANLLLLGGAAAAAGLAFATWVKRPGQRARFDRLLLRLPVVGAIAHKFATSQIARTLATLSAVAFRSSTRSTRPRPRPGTATSGTNCAWWQAACARGGGSPPPCSSAR